MSLYDHISVPEATRIQNGLREKLQIEPYDGPLRIIGGADISFNKYEKDVYAGIILLSFPSLQPYACSLVKMQVDFPYVSGYLAFREVPPLMRAWELLPEKPDLLVVDGHGIAHPRRMGIAAHFGTLSGQASIGCAKSKLCGEYEEPAPEQFSSSPLVHKGEVIGYVLRTKARVNPIFVSPGHKIDLPGSLDVIRNCVGKYRIPEPTRQAHNYVNLFRTGQMREGFHLLSRETLF